MSFCESYYYSNLGNRTFLKLRKGKPRKAELPQASVYEKYRPYNLTSYPHVQHIFEQTLRAL